MKRVESLCSRASSEAIRSGETVFSVSQADFNISGCEFIVSVVKPGQKQERFGIYNACDRVAYEYL